MVRRESFKVGDVVTLKPRKDGLPHRDGNDAKWEVIEVLPYGGLTIHLVGADESRTAAASPIGVERA